MEGDTPSFLGLVDNGLASYFNPSWGGWGGRYIYRQPYGESHPIWTQGGDAFARITSQDSVHGLDGKLYVSDQATIWRWRPAFQNDFVARMDWTIKEFPEANHAPVITLNGSTGTTPLYVAAEVGKPVVLDASASRDPRRPETQLPVVSLLRGGLRSRPGSGARYAGQQQSREHHRHDRRRLPPGMDAHQGSPAVKAART